MQQSGENHGHKPRIIASKTTKSENAGDFYMVYKDHKKEKRKVRPIATGNKSNTWGFTNMMESVANSEVEPYENISSEDMLTKKNDPPVLCYWITLYPEASDHTVSC